MKRDQRSRGYRLLGIAVLATYSVCYIASAWLHGPTVNEPGHLAAGIIHWRDGDYTPYRVNPPLVRMAGALAVLWTETARSLPADYPRISPTEPRGEKYPGIVALRPEYYYMPNFAVLAGKELLLIHRLARLAILPLYLIGPWVAWRWASHLWGNGAGLVALVAYCFSPTVLAYTWVAPDGVAAALALAAMYMVYRWTERYAWRDAIAAGLTMGVAQLAKFTLLVLYPVSLLTVLLAAGKHRIARSGGQFVAFLAISLLVINAAYSFHGVGIRLGDYSFLSRFLAASDDPQCSTPGNRFRGTVLGMLPVPLPADYVRGIDIQKVDFDRGQWSYLRGEYRFLGWYHYYVYAFLVKETVGTLVLVFAGLLLVLTRHASVGTVCCLVLPAAAVFAVVSAERGFNAHYRYVMPALPFLFTCAGACLAGGGQGTWRRVLVWACVAAGTASGLRWFPHCESYFNEIAGGPGQGWRHLHSSALTWEQDVPFLKQWLDAHPDVQLDGALLGSAAAYGVARAIGLEVDDEYVPVGPSGPLTEQLADEPRAGTYAVSVAALMNPERRYHYFFLLEPTWRVTPSLWIYRIDVATARQLRAESIINRGKAHGGGSTACSSAAAGSPTKDPTR